MRRALLALAALALIAGAAWAADDGMLLGVGSKIGGACALSLSLSQLCSPGPLGGIL